jgi:murein DD-endopeptidase MepM/ murein hydrolase activator NlpD
MKMKAKPVFLLLIYLLITAACSPAAASTLQHNQPSPTKTEQSKTLTPTPVKSTPTEEPTYKPPTVTSTARKIDHTMEPTPTEKPDRTPTACSPDAACLSAYSSQYFLARPIDEKDNDTIDISYRFGSTQGGRRDPHHGVEFLNGYGTPVLAAADGTIVIAGEDRDPISEQGVWPIIFYGPYSYFYGNLVVIEHTMPKGIQLDFPHLSPKIYTLYGHLSKISVEEGDHVKIGEKIGEVGMTGIAEGSHLHFEVRLGENTYDNSRNPELWLRPKVDQNNQLMGGVAGNLIDSYGNNIELSSIVLDYYPNGIDQDSERSISLFSYEDKALIGQPPWEESFAVGDLEAGWYRITYPFQGLQQEYLEVFPNQLTVIRLQPEE